jgi:hypothetical protein
MEIKHLAIPTVFTGYGKWGDWEWMQEDPDWAHTLFVFNDNEEQFDAYVNGLTSGFTPGAGNALARPWRQFNPPKAAGIPTGKNGYGYQVLDETTQEKIDQALTIVGKLLKSFYFDRLVFSSNEDRSTLGISTYKVGEDVRKYIFDRLMQTPEEWQQFINQRVLKKFRQLTRAIEDAKTNGLPIDSSNSVVQQLRDEMRAILRFRGNQNV